MQEVFRGSEHGGGWVRYAKMDARFKSQGLLFPERRGGTQRVSIHTTATWPAREDRRAALVWLAIFWIYVGVGFGFDLHNYVKERPPVPGIVHVHAIATTLWLLVATTLVMMVETGNVRFHRRFGWFAAGYAAIVVVIALGRS